MYGGNPIGMVFIGGDLRAETLVDFVVVTTGGSAAVNFTGTVLPLIGISSGEVMPPRGTRA